ncbi:MAG: hypothetical protein ACLVIY_09760 [Anaerobutyricum soehngenii]
MIADKLADYQMNYLADHAQTQNAEVRQIPEKMEQLPCQLCPIRHLIKSGRIALKEQKEAQDAEAAATSRSRLKAAKEYSQKDASR